MQTLKNRRHISHFVLAAALMSMTGCHGGRGGMLPTASTDASMLRIAPPMSTIKPKSLSPERVMPIPMVHTAPLPTTSMRSTTRRPMQAAQGLTWTQISGSASQVVASSDGSIWVLSNLPNASADKYIWHYANGIWTNISGQATHLAISPSGRVYAVNSGGSIYSWNGTAWTGIGGNASDITIANDGSLYVLSDDAGTDHAIWHYVGGTWSQLPGSGTSIVANLDPATYAIPNGNIAPDGFYIANSQGYLYYGTASGSYVAFPGTVSAIAPTTQGGIFALVYPANATGSAISYYNLDAPGWSMESGTATSLSANALALYAVSATNTIYSAMLKPQNLFLLNNPSPISTPSLVEYVTPYTAAPATITTALNPTALAANRSGDVFIANCGSVCPNTPGTGNVLEYTPPYTGTPNTISNGISSPYAIAFDGSDNLFVANQGTNTVTVYAPPYTGAPTVTISNGVNTPDSVAVDAHGDLFVANKNSNVTEYSPPYSGAPTVISNGVSGPTLLALDAGGNLFVGNCTPGCYGPTYSVTMYAPPYTGTPSTIFTSTTEEVMSLLVNSSGNLFVGEGYDVLEYAPPYTTTPTVITNGIEGPTSLAFDAAGNLFVSNSAGYPNLQEYAPPYTGIPTTITNGVGWPFGLAMSP